MVTHTPFHTSLFALQFILQLFSSYIHIAMALLVFDSMDVSYFILPSPYRGIFNLLLFFFFCNYKQCNKSFHLCASTSPGKIHGGGISSMGSLHFDRSSQMPLSKQSDNTHSHTIWATAWERDFTSSPTFSPLTT